MWPIALMVVLALAGPAAAAVYQCRDGAGNLFLTDDPDQFPPGCESEGVLVFDRETTETAPPLAPPSEPAEREPAPPPPPPETRIELEAPLEPPVVRWKEEARELSREYREMTDTTPVAPALPGGEAGPAPADQLRQFESLVNDFRRRLDQAPLTPAERAEVEAELPAASR